jgi:hypothetical protein
MVDNIRRADHIGVIKPPGQLRSVERRHQSRREHHHQGKDESPETPDDSLPTQAANPSKNEMDEDAKTSSGNENNPPTGRCIDVRI